MNTTISRRNFLKTAAGGAAAAAGLGGSLILGGCTANKDLDLVIKNGTLIDGTGAKALAADLGIKSGRVAIIGPVAAGRGLRLLDAKGLVVCPGFIDVHSHTDVELLVNPKAESAVRQGITTLVSGNCGGSPFPIGDAIREEYQANLKEVHGLDLTWSDAAGFLARLEQSGTAVNYATLVGQGMIRGAVVGLDNRPPQPEELERMTLLVEGAMTAGAFGLSSGLEYTPSSFAQAGELVELCRAAARHKGVYATHMRNEGEELLESLDESISAARESGISLQISHLKTARRANWDKAEATLTRVETARREGLDIFCDRYPYIAGSTGLGFFFPTWVWEGTTEQSMARLKDRRLESRIRGHVSGQEKKLGSWKTVLLCSVVSQENKWVEGLTVRDAAARSRKPAYEFMRDLLLAERGRVEMTVFNMSEDNLKRFLSHPLVGVGTDAGTLAPYGPLGRGKPHPRAYGTFPRVLGKYVREEKLAPLEAMIKKMTFLPARKFGFAKRGVVAVGSWADLVLFDPDTVADTATWTDPHRFPAGIPYVVINGRLVVDQGDHTGDPAGKVLRKA